MTLHSNYKEEKDDYFKEKEAENPFYDNHLFSRKDLKRATFSKWNYLWLWMHQTYVQVTDGYAFHYKIVNGAYWITKIESL